MYNKKSILAQLITQHSFGFEKSNRGKELEQLISLLSSVEVETDCDLDVLESQIRRTFPKITAKPVKSESTRMLLRKIRGSSFLTEADLDLNLDVLTEESLSNRDTFLLRRPFPNSMVNLVSAVLGRNKYLTKEIDKIYNENSLVYYESYMNSEHYKDEVLYYYPLEVSESIRKVMSIFVYEETNGEMKNIKKLIKKAYKGIAKYIEEEVRLAEIDDFNGSPVIFLESIYKLMHDKIVKNNKRLKEVSEKEGVFFSDEIVSGFVVAMFLASIYNITLISTHEDLIEASEEGISSFLNPVNVEKFKGFYKQIGESSEIIENLKREFLIPKKFSNIGDVLNHILEEEIREYKKTTKHKGVAISIATMPPFTKMDSLIAEKWEFLGVNTQAIFDSVNLSNEELNDILSAFYIVSNRHNFTSYKERAECLCGMLFDYGISVKYKESLRRIDAYREEDGLLSIKKKQIYFEEKEREYQEEKLLLKERNESLELKIKELQNDLLKTNKRNDSLLKEINEKENHQKELIASRNFIFSMQKDSEEPLCNDSLDDELELINGMDIAIISGNTNWISRMKEIIPNAKYIHSDNLNADLSILDKVDMVFYSTISSSHAFYYKLMSQMRGNETPLCYLSPSVNTEILTKEIHRALAEN